MEQTAEQLNSIIRRKYNALDDAGVIAISPADLAAAVFDDIDPKHSSPVLVQIAAVLELRQLARAVCRERQGEDERIAEQGNLFDFQLQPRYPAIRTIDGEREEVYVLRENLTLKERLRNIDRLRREAEAKMVHADALQAETDFLVRAGKLSMQEPVGTL
jgi:hypothetical protein